MQKNIPTKSTTTSTKFIYALTKNNNNRMCNVWWQILSNILGNLWVYRHQWYIAKNRFFNGYYVVKVIQGHHFGTDRRLTCDFLLVINTNLSPTILLLSSTAFKLWLIFYQIFASGRECLTLTPLLVSPVNVRMNFTSPETRLIVLPDTEERTIVSSLVWAKHWNVTDRRTDMLLLLQRYALRAMQTRCN